ncbi:hypothetical protein H310_00430 [Aphanomyces invadans]|uniref:UDP-N-acetylglucosamine--dolichyl-phosphate N-acetylglucosaminephosphotransferase n=2 Tax=Aphanomyces invadans TaxID=157072 RepID=A0A024UUM7_9STRA|nr:hypothetical protein H310_00430 [Aphanomyces invadans]ETW10039.1 hypothetical protein H310_00430 [Aphanomyces invadans]|eukprot:XP_008861450.1 hypothetical protein H310_00430 [Aphanomyces invadans]
MMWTVLAASSTVGYGAVVALVGTLKNHWPAKLSGKDLCKKGTPAGEIPIPEALGIVSGSVFVAILTVLSFFVEFNQASMRWGIVSIAAMITLGFCDDLLDLKWRHKLLFPPLATIPVLLHYSGVTAVVMPSFVRGIIGQGGVFHPILSIFFNVTEHGDIVDLGYVYYVYMGMMAVFCTNAINIYAGCNGLEAGQSFVIGLAVVVLNLTQVLRDHDGLHYHLFSLIIMLPFLLTTLGLLHHNWYPSRVFVGDTFCYYAGMTFAVAGILGHFSKTLLLFFAPQILNFIYSIPQLFKFIPCPRHRLPKFNPKTGNLEPSMISPDSTRANLTMLNLFLVVFGPMPEKRLVQLLLAFQVVSCVAAFGVRYGLSSMFYDVVH